MPPLSNICSTSGAKVKLLIRLLSILLFAYINGGGRASANTLIPPISIYMNVTDQFRDQYSGKLSYGGIPFISTSIQRRSDSPILDSKVDVYFGLVKPNGSVFSWIPAAPNSIGVVAQLVGGLTPVGLNMQLDTSISNDNFFTGSNRYITYVFSKDDVAGLYILFTLVVGTGKDPTDPGNWITSKTKIFPVKP